MGDEMLPYIICFTAGVIVGVVGVYAAFAFSLIRWRIRLARTIR